MPESASFDAILKFVREIYGDFSRVADVFFHHLEGDLLSFSLPLSFLVRLAVHPELEILFRVFLF